MKENIRPDGTSANPFLSPAVRFGNLLFTSGIVGRDPATGELGVGIEAQSRLTLRNIDAALTAAGTSREHVLKVTGFLASLDDKDAFNAVYREFFPSEPPARTCIQGGRLGDGILVEVEAIVGIPD
ncbi:MAG: RidA family protein [Thermomicrobiales bacterium]|nr:RidA family protein [Thermomicrobiales bacterium]